jgi:peroxiredoxin
MTEPWDPRAPQTGAQAPDLRLLDEAGRPTQLSQLARGGPLLLLFFAGTSDERGRALLRDYRDLTLTLHLAGVRLMGVAHAEPAAVSYLRMEMGMGFSLLADPDGTQLSRFGMDDRTGVFLLDRRLRVRERAPAGRAAAEALLQFIKRGGVRKPKVAATERIAHFFKAIQASFKPRRPLTR